MIDRYRFGGESETKSARNKMRRRVEDEKNDDDVAERKMTKRTMNS